MDDGEQAGRFSTYRSAKLYRRRHALYTVAVTTETSLRTVFCSQGCSDVVAERLAVLARS